MKRISAIFDFYQTAAGNWVAYMLLGTFGAILTYKDLPYEQVKAFTWWDWIMVFCGVGFQVMTVHKAFFNGSVAREKAAAAPPAPPPAP